jgi:molybdate transport system substrate-binding protein
MSAARYRITATVAGRLSLALLVWLAAGCQPPAQPAKPGRPAPDPPSQNTPAAAEPAEKASRQVVVFAAASTQEAVEAIVAEFRSSHPGVEVSANFGSSAALAKQIAEGASADLFLSASPQWVKFLGEKDAIAEEHELLGNELVTVVAAETTLTISKPNDLLRDEVEHIALGDPESVPAGMYAKQALSKLGLWEKVRDKLASAEDVRHALAMVETGAAEAGIVYATDAAVSMKVKLAFAFDSQLTDPIVYPLALTKQAAENPAARELYDYLQSAAAGAAFRRACFRVRQAAGVPQP